MLNRRCVVLPGASEVADRQYQHQTKQDRECPIRLVHAYSGVYRKAAEDEDYHEEGGCETIHNEAGPFAQSIARLEGALR